MSGLILAGNVILDRYVDGSRSNVFIGPINVPNLTVSVGDANRLQRKSYLRDSYQQNLDSVVIPGSPSITLTTDEMSASVMAYALLGSVESVSQTAGDVTDEAVTASQLDVWIKLASHAISSVVVQDATDTTTYVLDTDYTLDLDSGLIKFLSTGSINAADVLHVDYTKAATTSSRVNANQETDITAYIRLDGKNLATGKRCRAIFKKAVLAPSGEIPLIGGDDFASFELSGDLVTPDGETVAYYYEEEQ